MTKELNEDARTKQDLLYECSSLQSKLSNEIVKNEHLEQQCKKQKEVINKIEKYCYKFGECTPRLSEIIDILKEVLE